MSAVERFKRAHDLVLDAMEEERTWPHKRLKLDSAEEQAGTNPLINKNHPQQHKPKSAKKQAGANDLAGKNQALRREDRHEEPVPKQDAMQPSEQKPLQPEASEKSAKKAKSPTARTQVTKTQSALKLLQIAHDGLKQELKVLKEQQVEVIKREIEIALDGEVAKGIEEALAVVAEDVANRVEKTVKRELAADLESMKAETEKMTKKTTNDLQELRTELSNSEAIRKTSEEQISQLRSHQNELARKHQDIIAEVKANHEAVVANINKNHEAVVANINKNHEAAIANINKNHEAAIAQVKAKADQAKKEADGKLQQAFKEKVATDATLISMHKDLKRHNQLLEHQRQRSHVAHTKHRHAKQQFRLMLSTCRREDPEAMQCDTLPTFVTPSKSDVAPPTPESQDSPNFFTSSSSSLNTATAEKTGCFAHPRIPRPFAGWCSDSNATCFTDSAASKVVDGDDTAMHNHSRKGYSGEMHHNNQFDERSPASYTPSSQHHQFQPSAEQTPGTFGRPSGGHLAHVDFQRQQDSRNRFGPLSHANVHHQRLANSPNGAGQSNSRGAPRNAAVQTNYSQQHGDALSGAGQANSRRRAPRSHTQNAPNPWGATPLGNNNTPNFNGTSRLSQNTSSRILRHANYSNGAQHSNTGYVAPQLRNQRGFAQADSAPLSGPAQQTDYYAQSRLGSEDQRNAAHNNLSSPYQGQPQRGQRGRGRGGRGRSMNGRGGSRNGHTVNRNQAYDSDDEHDPRPVMAATRQYSANGAPRPQRNPFASRGGPSPGTFIPSIGDSFAEISRMGR